MTTTANKYDHENSRHAAYDPNYPPRPRRRLTPAERRRRTFETRLAAAILVAAGLIAGIAITSAVNWAASRNDTRDYGRELRYSNYTVQAGDTLWDIAQDMAAVNPEFTDVRDRKSVV